MHRRHALFFTGLTLTLSTVAPPLAQAHGTPKPRHGGIVQVANDLTFELVADAEGATLHLMDHEQALPAQGITGKLTVLQGAQKTELALREAGENRLRVTGVRLGKGDKVVAVLNNVRGRTLTVRYTLR
jgi:hypothetical protein